MSPETQPSISRLQIEGYRKYFCAERYSAFVGFRVLKVDYARGNYLYNVVHYGPVLGLRFCF